MTRRKQPTIPDAVLDELLPAARARRWPRHLPL